MLLNGVAQYRLIIQIPSANTIRKNINLTFRIKLKHKILIRKVYQGCSFKLKNTQKQIDRTSLWNFMGGLYPNCKISTQDQALLIQTTQSSSNVLTAMA